MEREPPVDTREAFKYIWKLWHFGGVIPINQFKTAFVFYSIFFNVTVAILFPATSIIVVLVEEDLQVALTNLSYSLSFLAFVLKHFAMIKYSGHLYKIRDMLKKLDKRVLHKDERLCLQDVVKFCHRMFKVYVFLFCSAVCAFSITPLFSSQQFVFPAWFPFDVTITRNYRIAYAFQMYGTFSVATQSLALDIFPPSYIYVLCAHIEALGIRIRRIGTKELKGSVIDNYKELKNCIEDYKIILNLFGEIKLLTSRTISLQFLVTAIILGTSTLNILFFKKNLFEIIVIIIFVAIIIFQVLPVCYCGNRLQAFNETLPGAIFNCNWIDEDKSFRKSIIIFMQRTQMDLEILAWNTVPITLPTFLNIVKFSVSMCAILNQLHK